MLFAVGGHGARRTSRMCILIVRQKRARRLVLLATLTELRRQVIT